MISRLEILPNELFFFIFSYLSWNEILTSFWSINERFDFLVCSAFTTNQTGILINQTGLSYKIFSSKFFQSITNCPSFISAVRRVHLDGRYSNGCEFYNHTRPILQYPNLQSLILTQCYLSESLIDNLSWLIEHRLNALTLILDEDIFDAYEIEERIRKMIPREGNRLLSWFSIVFKKGANICQKVFYLTFCQKTDEKTSKARGFPRILDETRRKSDTFFREELDLLPETPIIENADHYCQF